MSPIGIILVEYDMDSGYVYAKFISGDIILIDCDGIEKMYANNLYERSELDCLIYNDPASYVELILGKEVENYLKKITRYTPLSSLHWKRAGTPGQLAGSAFSICPIQAGNQRACG